MQRIQKTKQKDRVKIKSQGWDVKKNIITNILFFYVLVFLGLAFVQVLLSLLGFRFLDLFLGLFNFLLAALAFAFSFKYF